MDDDDDVSGVGVKWEAVRERQILHDGNASAG